MCIRDRRTAETGLRVISAFVVLAGLLGMMTALLSGLNERRREMAILRSVGAGPGTISGLLIGEALLLSISGIILGMLLLYLLLFFAQPILQTRLGFFLPLTLPGIRIIVFFLPSSSQACSWGRCLPIGPTGSRWPTG